MVALIVTVQIVERMTKVQQYQKFHLVPGPAKEIEKFKTSSHMNLKVCKSNQFSVFIVFLHSLDIEVSQIHVYVYR